MTIATIRYRAARLTEGAMLERARAFHDELDRRRSVRMFSGDPVPRELVELAIMTASTAPSGAHRQPWRFVVTGNPEVKRQVRLVAEEEERINYEGGRMPAHWREALVPLGTDSDKPYLERCPGCRPFRRAAWLFLRRVVSPQLLREKSVGIAAGLFIAAIHHMGLATLTHTPSPMVLLTKLLGRPDNERPFCLFPIGYPAADCVVPDLQRKPLAEVMVEV
ncbi:MAG: nitroreductase family protein [Acidimicrobiia bacterium]